MSKSGLIVTAPQQPLVLFTCHPLTGHITPLLKIANELKSRGRAVSFLSSTFFRPRIEASGLNFFPLLGAADLDDAKLFSSARADENPEPTWAVKSITDNRHQAIHANPDGFRSFKAALQVLYAPAPKRDIIVICEAFFYGLLPLKFGAPLVSDDGVTLKPPTTICVSITSPAIRSVDLPPFGRRGYFDQSPTGRADHAAAWAEWETHCRPVTILIQRMLSEAGATREFTGAFMDGWNYIAHDLIMQIGLPEFEYPRSDMPSHFRLAGMIPAAAAAVGRTDLEWWNAVISNADLDRRDVLRKKIVVVAQGTVETDPTELIIPTIEHLAGQHNALVIAILGANGASLQPHVDIPKNARVVDYLHYDAILPHADLWIHNGGYGATCHGIVNGVPMIIAGEGQDKPESGKRLAWCGNGLDLETARPTRAQLAQAIETVLGSDSMRETALQMKMSAASMVCHDVMERAIQDLGTSSRTKSSKAYLAPFPANVDNTIDR